MVCIVKVMLFRICKQILNCLFLYFIPAEFASMPFVSYFYLLCWLSFVVSELSFLWWNLVLTGTDKFLLVNAVGDFSVIFIPNQMFLNFLHGLGFVFILVYFSFDVQGGPKKTGPLCYIASNFRNTADIYTIFCRNQGRFILNTKT